MAKRRGNHEGSIYNRSDGNWRAQITIDGQRIGYAAKTRREAQDWLRHMGNRIEKGLSSKAANIRFEEFLNDWLKSKKLTLEDQSWRTYCQLVRDYIAPSLGKIKLGELTSNQIQVFYNDSVDSGVGLRTIQKTHTVIHAALNYATKMGMIGRNPEKATQSPKPVHKEMSFLKTEQVKILLETAKETNDPFYGLYYLALVTGMRQGELLALTWKNVDLEQGYLNVNYSISRSSGGGLVLKVPKTKSSVRSIKLGNDSIKVLFEQQKRLYQAKKNSNRLWRDTDHVFTSSIGTVIDPSNLLKQFRQLLKKAGLPKIRFHDLRHTAASLMLNNGVDVLVASQRLGHAKPSITLDVYGHLMPSMQNRAADVLEKLIAR